MKKAKGKKAKKLKKKITQKKRIIARRKRCGGLPVV